MTLLLYVSYSPGGGTCISVVDRGRGEQDGVRCIPQRLFTFIIVHITTSHISATMPVPAVTTSAGELVDSLRPYEERSELTRSAGSLALLNDEDNDIRTYALKHLLAIVPQFWAEISDHIAQL